MTLTALSDDLWVADHDLFTMGIHFPGRMTVVRLPSGDLWLCSPVPIDDDLATELDALGPVRWLVAPNRFHHVHLRAVLERYPEARLLGAPGLPEKRKNLRFEATLDAPPPVEWADTFDVIPTRGAPTLNEVLFYHRPSKTLITTDLFMNVHEVQGFLSQLVYRAEGCWRRARVPRIFALITKDKAAMQASLAPVTKLSVERIVLAHGAIVDVGAQALLEAELERAFGVRAQAEAQLA